MAVSKAQQKAVTKYVKNRYDRFGLTMPKGNLDAMKAHAEARGESVNGFVNRAITEAMERDVSGGPIKAPGAAQSGGGISLPHETMEAVQRAAEATGEGLEQFVERAVATQVERDHTSLRLGINPAAGKKAGE